jgi:hypothetical protein
MCRLCLPSSRTLSDCLPRPVKAWSESSQFRHHSPARINTRPHKDEKPVTLCALHEAAQHVLYIDPTASNRTSQETLLVRLLQALNLTMKKAQTGFRSVLSMQRLKRGRLRSDASSQYGTPSGCRSTTRLANQECSRNQSPGRFCRPRADTLLARKRRCARSGHSRA